MMFFLNNPPKNDGSYNKMKEKNVGGNFPWFSGLNTKLINSKRRLFQVFKGQGHSQGVLRRNPAEKIGNCLFKNGQIYMYIYI